MSKLGRRESSKSNEPRLEDGPEPNDRVDIRIILFSNERTLIIHIETIFPYNLCVKLIKYAK